MIGKVQQAIENYGLIKKGDCILVGLSGGMDSMALLDVLKRLQPTLGFSLCAAHLDHGIRDESIEDARFVANWCDARGITLLVEHVDIPTLKEKEKVSLEVAARSARHGFLKTAKAKLHADKIALAHHKNDQAETVLHRLIRGSSMDGLAAMAYISEGIIRPLLGITREEIETYCTVNNVPWREDHTNRDTAYTRNALRHETLPAIKERYNPAIIDTLCRTADMAATDRDYFDHEVSKLIPKAESTDDGYFMGDEDFLYLHPALRRRCIRRMMKELGLLYDVSQLHTLSVDDLFVHQGTGRKIELPYGYAALRHAMGVEIIKPDAGGAMIEETVLSLEGVTDVPGAGRFTSELLSAPPKDIRNHSKYVQYFDAMQLGHVVVRARRDGDRIHPLGAPGNKKLKDFFIDKKVSRWKRDDVPLLVCGDRILWAVGYAVDHGARVTEDTTAIYKITYTREEYGETI